MRAGGRLPGPDRRAWVALLVAQLAWVRAWAFVCDDAYISFRYARNLVAGEGLVFNPGERVEGYSNLLWVLLAAAAQLGALDPAVWLPLLSTACGLGVVAWTAVVLHRRLGCSEVATFAAVAPLALAPSMAVWSTSGLETMAAALAWCLAVEGLAFGRWRGALAGAALVLLRVDGALWLLGGAAAVLGARAAGPRRVLPQLLLGLTALAPLLALRVAWFGELVPNVVLVKGTTGPWVWLRGARYVTLVTMTCVSPALMALGAPAAWRTGGFARVAALLALGVPCWAVLVGGDFMPFGRLLIPSLPFVAVAFGVGLDRLHRSGVAPDRVVTLGLGVAAVGALSGFDLHLVPAAVRAPIDVRGTEEIFFSEAEKWEDMVSNTRGWLALGEGLRQLARPGDALVSGAIGAVGYTSGLQVYDRFGLVTPEVARRPTPDGPLLSSPGHDKVVPADFFLDRRPRFLYARHAAGRLAAGRMKDAMDEWDPPPEVRALYVPEIVEVAPTPAGERAFVLVVRLAEPGEDPAPRWEAFPERRRDLNAELRRTEPTRR